MLAEESGNKIFAVIEEEEDAVELDAWLGFAFKFGSVKFGRCLVDGKVPSSSSLRGLLLVFFMVRSCERSIVRGFGPS